MHMGSTKTSKGASQYAFYTSLRLECVFLGIYPPQPCRQCMQTMHHNQARYQRPQASSMRHRVVHYGRCYCGGSGGLVLLHGHLGLGAQNRLQVNLCNSDARGFRCDLCQHLSPGGHNQRASETLPSLVVAAGLGSRHHERLILDRTCAQQCMPVGLPCTHVHFALVSAVLMTRSVS